MLPQSFPLRFAAALALFAAPALPASALDVWSTDLPAALKNAKERGTLVFVDVWGYPCPSCEYMDQNVLNTPQMMQLRGKLELVKLDVSTPAGEEFSRSRRLFGIPIYMVLDPDGAELGMTRGDMPAPRFFSWLQESLARRTTLQDSEDAARKGTGDALASARDALNSYSLRNQSTEGLAFFESLPEAVRRKAEGDPAAGASLQMLRLYAARSAKDGAACLAPARRLVELRRGEIDAYELFVIIACSSYQPAEGQKRLRDFLEKPVRRLLKERVYVDRDRRGPDFRDAVQWAARYYEVVGQEKEAREIAAREK